jgi:hypothetical protein
MTTADMCGGDEQSAHDVLLMRSPVPSHVVVVLEHMIHVIDMVGAPPRGHSRSGLVGPLTNRTAHGGAWCRWSPGWVLKNAIPVRLMRIGGLDSLIHRVETQRKSLRNVRRSSRLCDDRGYDRKPVGTLRCDFIKALLR